ncbi:MAG: hypothetical protein ACRD2J_09725 [Thermoanaerobaculia bacterium]
MPDYRRDDESDAPDAKGATEDDLEKTPVIKGDEVLGYEGGSREEHSGQNAPTSETGLADNEADDLPGDES